MSLPRLPSYKGGKKRSSRKASGSNQENRPSLPTFVGLGNLTEAEVISETYRRSRDYSDESVVEKDEVSIEVESDELDVNYDENNDESISNHEVNLPDYNEIDHESEFTVDSHEEDHESEFTDDSYEAYLKQIAEDEGVVNHPSDLNEEIEGEDVEEFQETDIEDDLESEQEDGYIEDDYVEDEQELEQEEYDGEEYSFLPGIQLDEEDSENQVDSIVPEVDVESQDSTKTGKINKKKDPILKPLLDKIKSKIESIKRSRKESAEDKPIKPKKEKPIKTPKEKPLKEKKTKPAKVKKEKPLKVKKEKIRQHKQKLSFSNDKDGIKSVIKIITYLLTIIISIAIAVFLFKNLYSSYVPIDELSVEIDEESSQVLFDNFRKHENGLAFTATNKGDMSTQFFFDFYLRTTRTSEYKGEAFSCSSDIVVLETGGTFEGILNCEELPDNEKYKATIYIIEIN